VYWTDGAGNVLTVPTAGGPSVTLSSSPGVQYSTCLTVNATRVFWSNNGTLREAPIGGGVATPLLTGSSAYAPNPDDLAADSTNVYWGGFEPTGLFKAPVAGGAPTTMLVTDGVPGEVATDATNIYWSGGIDEDPPTIYIAKLPLAGRRSGHARHHAESGHLRHRNRCDECPLDVAGRRWRLRHQGADRGREPDDARERARVPNRAGGGRAGPVLVDS